MEYTECIAYVMAQVTDLGHTTGIIPRERRARWGALVVGLLCLCAAIILSLLGGITWYSPTHLFLDEQAASIVRDLRLPRTVCGILVGAGLSLVGVVYQSVFRNYLASPFSLGISSGAALVASVAVVMGLTSGRHSLGVGLYALLGALGSLVIISVIHRRQSYRNADSLLLVGIVFSFFCSSLMTLIQYVADYSQLFQVTRWMMGGIPSPSWNDLVMGSVCVGLVFVWTMKNARGLDLLLFGDDLAAIKGVDATKLSKSLFVFTSFVIGWVVAQCGVVGFVGIIVPALARICVGVSHIRVLPVAAVFGAVLIVLCDLCGRLIIPPFEIPAGVFTAVFGGPAFIWLLLTKPGRAW